MANERRLINAGKLEAAFCKSNDLCSDKPWPIDCILAFIDNAPTVEAVEVVRCGKCRKRAKGEYGMCHILCRQTHEDDFCSYGERKDNG